MNLFLSILVTCFCMPWPAVIMMSPMMVAAEGFAGKKSNILMALAFFLYPVVVFISLYLMGYSFYGSNPLWWAAVVFVLGVIVSLLYGLPRKFYNVSSGISNEGYFIKDQKVYL